MSADPERDLFDACVATASQGERERLLEQCPDPALRARVARLLAFVPGGSVEDTEPFERITSAPRAIGPYEILERIGEGGMGEVFLAQQTSPVRRRVAIKILKLGLATREVLARFDLEKQSLALMSHANIARMYDAGATPDGRPYFVMEHVPGIALTRFCDDRALGLRARLMLFAQVCQGVHHAHLRVVIHRDLKPSNVLVSELDGESSPKIIDFGIAKATMPDDASDAARTRVGLILGTPQYMSPEQALLGPLEVDARTDVYSLGVMLFELLCGERPYEVASDDPLGHRLARTLRDASIEPPSMRVSRSAESARNAAQQRGYPTPAALARALRGDLDWITLKALERDRERRFGSASEFAADLARALANEPVLAGPPSARYRLRKFVRRHRLAVGAAGVLAASLFAFGSGMAWLAQRAAAERDRANAEAEIARRVTGFTAGLFELANPAQAGAWDVSARELLDAGVRRLSDDPAMQRADVRAALLESAANAYRGLGEPVRALPLIEEAVALRRAASTTAPSALAQALLVRAQVDSARGEFASAEQHLREALSLPLEGEAAADAQWRRLSIELAHTLRLEARHAEAESLARLVRDRCAAARPVDVACMAAASLQVGRALSSASRLAEAEPELARALALHREAFGERSEATLEAKDGLADLLVIQGRSAEAEPLLREIVADRREIYGELHPGVGVALSNLGNALSDFPEKLPESERVYAEALRTLRASYGPAHPELATTLNNVGFVYGRLERWEDARRAYREATEIRRASIGPSHPDTAAAELGEALALNKLGQLADSEALLRKVIDAYSTGLGATHWRTANAQRYLGTVLTNLGRFEEAGDVLEVAERNLAAGLGDQHERTRSARQAREELARAERRMSR